VKQKWYDTKYYEKLTNDMEITQVEKRNMEVVAFNEEKIWKAISKAFLDVQKRFTEEESKEVDEVTEAVVRKLTERYPAQNPTVENVQDLVEETLMEWGYYEIAKGYILYRHERESARQQETSNGANGGITVVTASGATEPFREERIRKTLQIMSVGYEDVVDIESMVQTALLSVYDRITPEEITKALILTARSFIEADPAYSYVAARLLLRQQYARVIGVHREQNGFEDIYRRVFVENMNAAVRQGFLDRRVAEMDLEWLSRQLKPDRDRVFTFLGLQTLVDRYFVENPETGVTFEVPQIFWMRVAMGLAIAEDPQVREQRAVEFYEVMSTLQYVPSTPTLFNAGTDHPQLASCYLNVVGDDLDHIFKVYGDNARLSKWTGGIGTSWTNVRGTGSLIRGTGVASQGIVPFLKIANDVTAAINRSGKRRGAAAVYLETWHLDIEDFLDLRKNTGDDHRRTHDMNTANWIPDLFMKRVREDANWTLFSPDEVPDLPHTYGQEFEKRYEQYEQMAEEGKIKLYKKMSAMELWKKMITMLFETGHPWITFKDPSNVRSPQDHVGVIHNSNLCTEITLNTSQEETAVCNLGSINLSQFVTNQRLETERLKEVVPTAMRMLDNVVDLTFYPTQEAYDANVKHRPVGLGIMGFQDALYQMDIPFDSEECVRFSDRSMEAISYYAISASAELAAERGAYASYNGSKWDRGLFPIDTLDLLEKERGRQIEVDRSGEMDWSIVRETVKRNGMRNSNCLALAPTATISNIAGATPTIEPIYKNIYVKSNQAGDFTVINQHLVNDLKKMGLWTQEMREKIKYYDGNLYQIEEIPTAFKEKYKEAFDIHPQWMVKAAAHRGKWIDQSQSLNIFYQGTSGREIADVYTYAWDMGLKTSYYLRTLAVSQVEKSTLSTSEHGVTHKRSSGNGTPTASSGTHEANGSATPTREASSNHEKASPGHTPSSHSATKVKTVETEQVCEACE
jgi:ribonucleoside-diphosphate reductase alpha chain